MNKPKIAITAGDTNGVGYEIILKTLNDPYFLDICTPIIYGNTRVATIHKKTLSEIVVTMCPINSAKEAQDKKVSIINCTSDNTEVKFGEATKESATAAFQALERACADLKAGLVDALVTAPINKATIQSADFHFPGHTEYLASQFGREGEKSLMMMVSNLMRVALVTNHMPISKVAGAINEDLIIGKLQALQESLKQDFSIRHPRIAVLALNPHAGDNGFLGTEEKEIITPALKKAKDMGISAYGPFSSDGFMGMGKYKNYDAILAMYHDQGLIPFKALDMSGVNFTAGLSIVRTSPDHGTGYEIAGKNMADEQSFRQAVYTAVDVVNARALDKSINANPLEIKDKKTPRPEVKRIAFN